MSTLGLGGSWGGDGIRCSGAVGEAVEGGERDRLLVGGDGHCGGDGGGDGLEEQHLLRRHCHPGRRAGRRP